MKRRHFIHAATALVLLPAAAKPCHAALASFSRPDYVFFDERFHQSRRAAASWAAASNRLIGVHGDVTAVWTSGLDRMTRHQPLHLRGVTTESFLFCLKILAGEHANLDVRVSRLDRNLLEWTMNTHPILIAGQLHG